jgi:hypothetical protein
VFIDVHALVATLSLLDLGAASTSLLTNALLLLALQALLLLDVMEELVLEREKVGDTRVLLDLRPPFWVL